jgi:hypothetical protein
VPSRVKATTTGPPGTAHKKLTRWQAAILVADVVGYSRMMAEDAGATLRAIRVRKRKGGAEKPKREA